LEVSILARNHFSLRLNGVIAAVDWSSRAEQHHKYLDICCGWLFSKLRGCRNACYSRGGKRDNATFFWHLGNYRNIYQVDEDFQRLPEHPNPVNNLEYYSEAWDDFIRNQLGPFGATPVFLTRGRHEAIPPMTPEKFLQQFADWLLSPAINSQRLRDDPSDHLLKSYYHWVSGGVDFIALDNSTPEQFDQQQIRWFRNVLSRTGNIKTVVVGMNVSLPNGVDENHSMGSSPAGSETGRQIYRELLKYQNDKNKHIYLLSSSSNFFLANNFNTEYWHFNGGVIPGWVVGTAGAVRYALPAERSSASAAETDVYGYLLGKVSSDGTIEFVFNRVSPEDVPSSVVQRFSSTFVQWCFNENSLARR
jgi:hypothetical protein